MGALSPEEFDTLAGTIEVQLHQTSYLLENLLHWSKTQMEGESFTPANTEIQAIFSETLHLFDREFNQKKIQPVNLLQAKIMAFADTNMIRTVLRNLVSNALKFTSPNGKITLNAKLLGRDILISIQDTGMGIPSRYLKNIFTLQGITTVGTREEKGTGIGLVLCKEFVEKNGGKIWVESKEGEGTTFYFTIPKDQYPTIGLPASTSSPGL